MPDGSRLCESEHSGREPERIFDNVISDLLSQGAQDVINAVREV